MTNQELLEQQIAELQRLARMQRGLRLGLRALWLGMVGILLGWSSNAIWGWPSNPEVWLVAGLVLALFPAAAFALSLSPRSRWVWTMDRSLGLREQASTAWEVLQKGQGGRLSEALVEDVLGILPGVRARMMKHGWFLAKDVVAALIVFLLGCMVLTSALVRPTSELIGEAPEAVIPPVAELQPADQQPPTEQPSDQIPQAGAVPDQEGAQPGNGSSEGELPGENAGPGSEGNSSGTDPGELAEALRQLGKDLSRQAGTYDLGQALEQLDLDRAAGELEGLSDQLDDLSPESRENLADALREAAEVMEEAGEQSLAEDLRGAADALQGLNQEPGEALEQVAGDLRQLAEELGASALAGAGAGEGGGQGNGNPEPLNRLQGEGGDMELPLDDSSQSGLLSPAPPEAGGDGTASGSQDSTYSSSDDVVQSPLLPNSYLWKYRDVVSDYFTR